MLIGDRVLVAAVRETDGSVAVAKLNDPAKRIEVTSSASPRCTSGIDRSFSVNEKSEEAVDTENELGEKKTRSKASATVSCLLPPAEIPVRFEIGS